MIKAGQWLPGLGWEARDTKETAGVKETFHVLVTQGQTVSKTHRTVP